MKSKISCKAISRAALLISGFMVVLLVTGVVYAALSAGYKRQQPITMEKMAAPGAVALDAQGNLYVAESPANTLHVFSASGDYLKSYSYLFKPVSVAVDSKGRIFVGNAGRGNVEVYNGDFILLSKLGAGDGEFTAPTAIATDLSGKIYVADSKADVIKVYNSDGSFRFSFGASGSQDGKFHFPTSLAVNNASQEVYVTDLPSVQTRDGLAESARVQVFTLRGVFKRSFGNYGTAAGMLTRPMGIAVNGSGRVFVTDSYKNVVEVFDTSGAHITTIYDAANPMSNPLGIAANGAGSVFIASINTGKIEVYSITQ
jgi:sugar lactone lactonase YvrE